MSDSAFLISIYSGKLRYANNSNYKNDTMIRKEAYVHKSVIEELKRIIEESEVMQEDDALWPPPDRVGRQVPHIRLIVLKHHLLIAILTSTSFENLILIIYFLSHVFLDINSP